ncbi:GDP-mannose 4,6-dehydratase, partial [Paraburkholderia dipogonis]|uniref:GDP-mannose 4,6-dehydratase n=1 Tax=Paraburkholderia dipogonis TaxID=1211383 RepID=UPI00362B5A12
MAVSVRGDGAQLTYAVNLRTLKSLQRNSLHIFECADICDRAAMDELLAEYKLCAIIRLAAESHVDRSIHGPESFVQTNVVGAFTLLEAARSYWSRLNDAAKAEFRFLHISTDDLDNQAWSDEVASGDYRKW